MLFCIRRNKIRPEMVAWISRISFPFAIQTYHMHKHKHISTHCPSLCECGIVNGNLCDGFFGAVSLVANCSICLAAVIWTVRAFVHAKEQSLTINSLIHSTVFVGGSLSPHSSLVPHSFTCWNQCNFSTFHLPYPSPTNKCRWNGNFPAAVALFSNFHYDNLRFLHQPSEISSWRRPAPLKSIEMRSTFFATDKINN